MRKRMIAGAASLILGAALVGGVAASDNLIVPGARLGPVKLASTVDEIVKMLGRPDRQRRDTTRVATTIRVQNRDVIVVNSDMVTYGYTAHCLWFTWDDEGLRPKVKVPKADETTAKGIGLKVTCSRWRMENGLGVGSSIEDILNAMGEPNEERNCKTDRPECTLVYWTGVWFHTRNRHSRVHEIHVVAHK